MSNYDDIDREIDREMGWDRGEKGSSDRRSPGYWQAILRTARVSSPILRILKSVLRAIGKVVFFPVVSPLGYSKRFSINGDMIVVKRSLRTRVLDGILTRLLLTPIVLAVFFMGVVYATTHPKPLRAISTPDGYGMYFKRVNLVSVDNRKLMGWYIPPQTADEVTFDTNGTLSQKWPGVVICHGLGQTHDHYLPLAQELHAGGFAVLLLDTRGQGESDYAPVTYGLRERLDVLAGVKYLQELAYIDETKVSVVGHDIGAMAVLQAAALDASIAAVVADGLWPKFDERARDAFSRTGGDGGTGNVPTQWLAPLFTLTFEVAIRDRLADLDPVSVVHNIRKQPVIFIAHSGPPYASVQDVMTLATTIGAHHEVIIANDHNMGDTEHHICNFLVKSTGWKGPNAHGVEQIQNLLKNRVDK